MTFPPAFPFTALQGQQPLQTALLLVAVDPLLGGVLVEGPRGTAKSTSARALAALLPAGRFVNLPLGATEEQLVGTLDLEAALQGSRVQFRPGLLAQAHQGILYVDEVNLLADGLVDLLLDVSASGINRVERDGVSHQHPARIALIGTMNPEEGQLRPQLLDRFGLFVQLDNVPDVATRKAIVKTRMAYDADHEAFAAQYAQAQQALARRVATARASVASLDWSDAVHEQVAQLCQQAGVEGVRADLVMLRAARAHAALAGRSEVTQADVTAVAELALAHRRSQAGDASQASPPPPSEQQPASTPPPPTAASQADTGNAQSPGESQSEHWGALPPPQATGLQTVKPLKALAPKKA
ncbi:ATP-binding protein [Comamonas antarctica]|uniref:ATP-binding protein n=1 Tax=Comamonas antarctica TaxID=2743470 RepID=A0A6N1X778_9BURK|nr:ATP-binding protein [Comamonas antarctica]QKV55187.1 ATP-binding protein [Comamonas antarctica]